MFSKGRSVAILCDLDDVIRSWNRLAKEFAAIEAKLALPNRALLSCAFHPDLLHPVIAGVASHEEWVSQTATALTDIYGTEASEQLVECWLADRGQVNAEVMDILRHLRSQGHQLILVTNATDRLDEDLQMLDIFDAFDEVVNSSTIGTFKPHKEIYQHAVACSRLSAEQCIFIDDKQVNVDAAKDLGITGVLFENAEQLRFALAHL